jgi:hypothetical protein
MSGADTLRAPAPPFAQLDKLASELKIKPPHER